MSSNGRDQVLPRTNASESAQNPSTSAVSTVSLSVGTRIRSTSAQLVRTGSLTWPMMPACLFSKRQPHSSTKRPGSYS